MGISNGSGITIENGATLPINLSTDVTGTLPIVNGGTGASTVDGARLNLLIVDIPTYTIARGA